MYSARGTLRPGEHAEEGMNPRKTRAKRKSNRATGCRCNQGSRPGLQLRLQ
jgi:hypothetical protein